MRLLGAGTACDHAIVPSARHPAYADPMHIRTKKFIGTIVLVAFVVVYMTLAMAVTARWLPESPVPLQLLGYAAAGLLWIVPAGLVIRWMSRDSTTSRP